MAENSKKSGKKSTTEEVQQQKRCFVMMPFSDPEGYDKGHFRKIYEQIIKPAIEKAGYKPDRVDENGVSDLITTKIFQSILDCEMAICDLSSRNPNVLYELGIRHAFDKPVVLITDDKTERIFDIQGISTITYRSLRLYDEVPEDQKKITEAIIANENNSSGYSILNMINLQKATYDTSIKDTNSSEINNALLMRIVNALEERDQKTSDLNNQIYSKENKMITDVLKKANDRLNYFLDSIENSSERTNLKFLTEAKSELSNLEQVIQGHLNSSFMSSTQIQKLKITLSTIKRIQTIIDICLERL